MKIIEEFFYDTNKSGENEIENMSAASEKEQRPEHSGTDTHPNSTYSKDEEGTVTCGC